MPMGTGRPLVALPQLDLLFAEAAWAFHSPCEAGKEILAPPGLLSIDPPLPRQTVPSTDGPPTSWQHLSPVVVGCVVVPPAGRTFVRPMESPLPKSRWGQAVGSSLPQLQGNLDQEAKGSTHSGPTVRGSASTRYQLLHRKHQSRQSWAVMVKTQAGRKRPACPQGLCPGNGVFLSAAWHTAALGLKAGSFQASN